MAVTVEKLYESVRDQEIELLAGKGGLKNVVRWVHMVENIEISSFLEGGEISFITGVGLEKPEDLLELVKAIIENKANGIVLNLGPFIKKIQPEIMEYCDEHNIPLFSVPWHTHMAKIMKDFCCMITQQEKHTIELSGAIKNAIYYPEHHNMYVPPLEALGLKSEQSYCIAVLKLCGCEASKDNADIKKLIRIVENYSVYTEDKILCFDLEELVILVYVCKTDEEVEADVIRLREYIGRQFNNKCINIGIGQHTKNIYCIYKSFTQAKSVLQLNTKSKVSEHILKYRDLGVYKLLLSIDDRDMLKEYYKETIGILAEYDKFNNMDLTKVLRSYILNNASVQETARELFVHRNTVNYKINKIEEIMKVNLSCIETRTLLDIGYKVYDLLE